MKLLIALIALSATNCQFGLFNEFLKREPSLSPLKELLKMNGSVRPLRRMQAFKDFGMPAFMMSQMPLERVFQGLKNMRKNKLSNSVTTEVIIVEQNTSPVFGSKWDKCLDRVEVIFHNLVKCAKLCLDKKWEDTIPISIETVKEIKLAVLCFNDPKQLKMFPDPVCVIEHLNKAVGIIQDIAEDIQNQKWSELPKHLRKLYETLADIVNC